MSDKEADFGDRSKGKRGKGQRFKPEMVEKTLNLSEDESSEEDIMVNVNPLLNQEESSVKITSENLGVSDVQTSYDFSRIIKLQEDLVEARDRFNSSVAMLESELEITPDEQLPSIVDKYSVEELLHIGEREKVIDNNLISRDCVDDESGIHSLEIIVPGNYNDKELRRQKNKEVALTKHLNKVMNERQKDLHKVHLLCLIAHGNFLTNIINNDLLYGCALSFLPKEYSPPPLVTLSYIQRLVKWFGNKFPHKKHKKTGPFSFEKLEEVFSTFKPCTVRDSVILFVSLLRGLSLTARIVINFNPVPLKIKKVVWSPRDTSFPAPLIPTQPSFICEKHTKSKPTKKVGEASLDTFSFDEAGPSHKQLPQKCSASIKSSDKISSAKKDTSKLSVKKSSSSTTKRSADLGKADTSEAGPSTKSHQEMLALESLSKPGTSKSKVSKPGTSKSNVSKPGTSKSSVSKPGTSKSHTEIIQMNPKVKSSDKSKNKHKLSIVTEDELSCARVGVHTRLEKADRPLIMDSTSSSEDELVEETETTVKCGIDYWAEVFIESEERWVSVDLFSLKVDCVREIANRCTQPISYIVGWKNDGSLKDVTRRYAVSWLTKKHRVEPEWWAKTLLPFLCKNYELDVMEEDQLNEIIEKAPMPTSINELKNHPLYVLPRHLLKYEAIYPRDAVPLGYARGEPVFSRFCVQVLCSREKWFRQGKVIKLDEIPYKLVNPRSKSGKFKDSDIKPLELFGKWQVVDYVPPPVVDGKVPVNEYGNIEIYKPTMLPAGAVHIQVPGLMKVAQKLGIDCVPAVVGWQHHCGTSHPEIDGVVVAKEFQDVLLDAWNADVDISENKYSMKRKARAKKNWLKICKVLLIREHLKKKYNFGEQERDYEPQPKLKKK